MSGRDYYVVIAQQLLGTPTQSPSITVLGPYPELPTWAKEAK